MWQASQLNGWLQTYCVLRSYLDHLVKRAVSSSGWSHGFPTVLIRVVSRSAAALNTLDMLLYKVTHFYLCSLYHQLCVAHRFSLFLEFLKIQLSSVLVRICIDCSVVKPKVAFFFFFFFLSSLSHRLILCSVSSYQMLSDSVERCHITSECRWLCNILCLSPFSV